MPDDPRKAAAKGAAPRAYNGGEAQGRDKGKGARLHTVGGIGGEEREGRSRRWKAGRHDGRKYSAWRSGMSAAPRACVYI